MATVWFNPQLISQYAEDGAEDVHIRWDDSTGYANLTTGSNGSIGTLGSLVNIARSPKPNITNKTYYLKMTRYNLTGLPDTISGIELAIKSRRVGRVTDETVSLTYNNALLGDNQASLIINPTTGYGGETFLWGLDSITKEMLQDPSFGVVVRFKSHPSWPHNDPMDLISVQLRIH
jgi:hypothetical protein